MHLFNNLDCNLTFFGASHLELKETEGECPLCRIICLLVGDLDGYRFIGSTWQLFTVPLGYAGKTANFQQELVRLLHLLFLATVDQPSGK